MMKNEDVHNKVCKIKLKDKENQILMQAVPTTQVARKECVTITGTVPGDRSQGSEIRDQRSKVRRRVIESLSSDF